MKRMKTVVRIAKFICILEVVFIIHEYGHLREFQKQGVPIQEFSLGIGPIICEYKTTSFAIQLRPIPIMAYVATTDEGGKIFNERASLWNKIIVHCAGVRNNFLVGVSVLFFLQWLGWRKGYISTKELVCSIAKTPILIGARLIVFLVGCATLGYVNLVDKVLVPTGEIRPWWPVSVFTGLNIWLAILNIVPVFPLDGGRVASAIVGAIGNFPIPHISDRSQFLVFLGFLIISNFQDTRLFESEKEEGGGKMLISEKS